jgi:hypothetical protein
MFSILSLFGFSVGGGFFFCLVLVLLARFSSSFVRRNCRDMKSPEFGLCYFPVLLQKSVGYGDLVLIVGAYNVLGYLDCL